MHLCTLDVCCVGGRRSRRSGFSLCLAGEGNFAPKVVVRFSTCLRRRSGRLGWASTFIGVRSDVRRFRIYRR
jgi:hypothetical protein